MKLRLPGRRRGSTPEERPPTSAGSGESLSSVEFQDTFREHDPTSATSAAEHADLDVVWVRPKGRMRSFTHAGVEYVIFGERAGEYMIGVNTAGEKMGGTLDHGPFQTLEDCKDRIRMRLNHDIARYAKQ